MNNLPDIFQILKIEYSRHYLYVLQMYVLVLNSLDSIIYLFNPLKNSPDIFLILKIKHYKRIRGLLRKHSLVLNFLVFRF